MAKSSNKPGGKPSKRISSKNVHKVEKKVKEHHRKMKKEANKLKALGVYKRKMKGDSDVPNLFPYKQ